MAKFNSDQYEINTPPSELSAFLAQPSNLRLILPEERIENWKEREDGCSFKIKGLADIQLKLESASNEEVVYASVSSKPFAFKLIIKLNGMGESTSSINALFDAEVNAFMGTMIKTPLTNFLNSLGEAIKHRYA